MMRREALLWGALVAACAPLGCGDDGADPPVVPGPNLGHPPASAPPSNTVGGFSIDIPDEVLSPGEEAFPCWIFPLVVEGPSHIVGGGKLATGPGMHHGNITARHSTGTGMRRCGPDDGGQIIGGEAFDIINGGAVLFGSSTQIEGEEWQSFPEGMGYRIVDDYEIVARMHYVNVASAEVTVAPHYEWFTVDEASVEQILGPFAWNMTDWEIPPLSTTTVVGECTVPGPMHIVNALPHMHALGTAFFGEYVGGALDGERWLDSVGYDPDKGVITQYTPAIDLGQGDGMRFGCTWDNTFDKVIHEGVGDNEMCILFGYAYPYDASYSGQATPAPGGGCAMVLAPPPEGE